MPPASVARRRRVRGEHVRLVRVLVRCHVGQARVPELIVDALEERLGLETDWRTATDLGCGTGLAGMLLRPRVGRLVGVDLSQTMLDRARRRNLYDQLTQANLVSFLHGETESFDVVVAADVFCYFGVLDEVIAGAAHALRPGGVIAFTVESLPEGSDGWSLALTGRYAHSPRYITAAMVGFDAVAIDPCELRMEAGRPVPGLRVIARRR
ncbi:MAG: methyltransferase [Ilumatobacteraceae bacterium]